MGKKVSLVPYHQVRGPSKADNMCIAIESRVARIKARVAELTGNIDQSNAPTPAHGTPRRN